MSPSINETVQPNMVVGLVYTLKSEVGQLLEARPDADPLFYLHGHNQLLPVVEATLKGKKVGDRATIKVAPAQGYGEYQTALVADVEREAFPKDVSLKVGMRFDTQGPDGESLVVEIKKIENETVTIDGNHPLAGVTLEFDLRVHSLRAATTEELSHGHVHGAGGHVH